MHTYSRIPSCLVKLSMEIKERLHFCVGVVALMAIFLFRSIALILRGIFESTLSKLALVS